MGDKADKVLCVDGGGSNTQVCICKYDDFSAKERYAEVGSLSLKSSSASDVRTNLEKIAEMLESEGLGASVKYSAFALSGLDTAADIERIISILKDIGFINQPEPLIDAPYGHIIYSAYGFPILLCSDALLPLFAEGRDKGVSLISGTGSVALSVSENGECMRFGGRGYRTSDLGSGYWVGTHLMQNAVAASEMVISGHMRVSGSFADIDIASDMDSDARCGQDLMLAHSLICASIALGFNGDAFDENADLDWIDKAASEICMWVASHDDPKDYASLARFALEHDGLFELGLCEETASRLSQLAALALRGDGDTIVASGGIFKNHGVGTSFTRLIQASFPDAEIIISDKNLLIGALNIATKAFKESISGDLTIDCLKAYPTDSPSGCAHAHSEAYGLVKRNGVYLLQSNALSRLQWLDNGTTLRQGGTSMGFASSLNFCLNEYDRPDNVAENYSIFCDAIGVAKSRLASVRQIHSSNIIKVDGESITAYKQNSPAEGYGGMWLGDADALITDIPGIALCIYTADCVPISIADPTHNAIGVVHAGWRGTLKEIASKTIAALADAYGTSPEDVIVQIGPSICPGCYEVDDVVVNEARKVFDADELDEVCTPTDQGKYQFDLQKANSLILSNAGVLPKNIYMPNICTCCNNAYLFSHRATNGRRGTQVTYLRIK